jgi:hypothetical protein
MPSLKIIGYAAFPDEDTSWLSQIDWSKVTSLCLVGMNASGTSGAINPHTTTGFRNTVITTLHAKGCMVEEVLDCADATLGTIATNGGAALTTLASNITNMIVSDGADGLSIDWEYSGITTAQMDTMITALYNSLHAAGKTLSIYYGNYLLATPGALASSSVANACLWYIAIGVYYDVVAANNVEAAMTNWAGRYNKSLLVCTKDIAIYDAATRNFAGIYSDLWDAHNSPAPATNIYSRYYATFYSNFVIDSTDWPVGNNAVATTLTWDCVAQVVLETQWIMQNGYGGIGLFCFTFDLPTSNPDSLLANIYGAMVGAFAAGSVKTANFQVTFMPSGLPCEIEVWLSPDGTTKAATSGLVVFTSTGRAQPFALPITMPAAGIYQVLKDLYLASTLYRFSDNPVAVV